MAQRIPCNVCGSVRLALLYSGTDRNYKVDDTVFFVEQCRDCGLVFVNPQPTETELQKYYPEEYGAYERSVSVLRYGPVSSWLKKRFAPHKRARVSASPDTSRRTLLDVGCGNGTYLEKMRRHHPQWELHGFDNSEFARTLTKQKGFNVWGGDFVTAELPEEHFDIVYLSHVIEHFNDPKAAVGKIHHLLKPGGKVILIAPNIDSVAARVFGKYWYGLDLPRHLFDFSPATLSRLLFDAGFKEIRVTCDPDTRVGIMSLNYLFDREDRRINFFIWHFLRLLCAPFGVLLAHFKKTSIMTVEGIKTTHSTTQT